jgi:hypothetical protein
MQPMERVVGIKVLCEGEIICEFAILGAIFMLIWAPFLIKSTTVALFMEVLGCIGTDARCKDLLKQFQKNLGFSSPSGPETDLNDKSKGLTDSGGLPHH